MRFQAKKDALPPVKGEKAYNRLLDTALLLFALSLTASAQQKDQFPSFSVSSGTPLLSARPSTGAIVAQGGNYSVPLPDGRTLWLLNNIWTGELKAGGQAAVWGIVDGAAAFSPSTSPYAQAGSLSYISDEHDWPLPLLSGDLGEYSQVRKFWPRSGICAAGKCHVFYSVMHNFGPEPYDYFRVGQGVAFSDNPAGPYTKARMGRRYSLWNDIEPAFGSALWSDEDGWVYVYGRSVLAPGEYAAELARVRPENLDAREKYYYYSVDAATDPWTQDISEASAVMENMPDEFSVSYNVWLKSYLAVYYDAEGARVVARQARYPWGPWGAPAALLACAKTDYCFGAKEQAGFAAAGGGRIFITLEKKNAPYIYEVVFK